MKRFPFKAILQRRNHIQHYPVKLLGSVLCSHPGVDEICRAMAQRYTVSRQKIRKLSLYNLTVTSKGITLEKIQNLTESSPKKFVIERIVYCGVDKQHQKIFAFFYRSPESIYGALDCHVIECRSKRHAKHIALKMSKIFEDMAAAKEEEIRETSFSQVNAVQERTASMIQLHMSVESLLEEQACGSPQIQRSKPREIRLNYSELQLHSNGLENNSSGYGDSSDGDLSNKIEQRKHVSSVQVVDLLDGGESSKTGHVKRDYVNTRIVKSKYVGNKSSKRMVHANAQTHEITEIKEWDSSKKDRNDNPVEKKTLKHEYMNINMKKPGVHV